LDVSDRAWEERLSMQLEKTNLLLKALIRINLEPKGTSSDKILALNSLGMTPSEIAELLGTTANTVSVTLHKARKQREQGGKKHAKEESATAV
jgi:CRP-like cAMP-binding protein